MPLIKNKKSRSGQKVKQLKHVQGDAVQTGLAGAILGQVKNTETPEITLLKAENVELKKQLEQLKLDSKAAIEDVEVKVREQVKKSIKQDFSKAYDKLSASIDKAIGDFEDQLASTEALSLLVAQTALEKIFHPTDNYHELTARMIKKQMQGLRRETVVEVRVSGDDFESNEALEDLAFALDLNRANIKISQKLQAGDCIIDLRLGRMELSINNQWEELKTLFKTMAMEESLS